MGNCGLRLELARVTVFVSGDDVMAAHQPTKALASFAADLDPVTYCRISTSGSEVAGIRSQVVASLSEKRQLPPRPLSSSPSLSSRQVESPMSATDASQPGLTAIL